MSRRPGGTDGSDHQYRMVIENKYEKLAKQRKWIHKLVNMQLQYVIVRGMWHYAPAALVNEGPPVRELVYAGIGLISVALYYRGAGGGNAQRESLSTLKLYTLVAMIYLALATLAAFQYHVMWDDKDRYHHVYADKLAPTMGVSKDIVETAARIAGPAMDVVGLSSVFIALNTCKGYCLEKEASLKAPRAAAVETNVQSEQPTRRGARRRVM